MKSKATVELIPSVKLSLRNRKQQVVHAALYNAAIDLFAEKGFDETTVEEVAILAGVSRRSFFRYFSSKDDLLAQSVVSYGQQLAQSITRCPPGLSPLRVIEETVLAGVEYTSRPGSRMREVITIAAGSRLARQAHASRMMEIEDLLSAAFAEYFKGAADGVIQSRMLAGITLSLMGATILSWFKREYADLSTAAKHIFASFSEISRHTPTKVSSVKAKSVPLTSAKSRAHAPHKRMSTTKR